MSRSKVIRSDVVYQSNWPQGKPTGPVGFLVRLLEKLGARVILAPPHGKPGGWLTMLESTFTQEVNGEVVERKWLSVSRNGQTGLKDKPDAVVVAAIHEADDGARSLVITDEFRVPLNAPGDDPGVREYGFPAGLLEKDQTPEQAAAVELKQETGLDVTRFVRLPSPFTVSTAGMSNETSQILFCYCKGTPSRAGLEPFEDINTTLVPFNEIRPLLSQNLPWSARAACIMTGLLLAGKLAWEGIDDRLEFVPQGNRVSIRVPGVGEVAIVQGPAGIPMEVQVIDGMQARLVEPKNVAEVLEEPEQSSSITFMTGKQAGDPLG